MQHLAAREDYRAVILLLEELTRPFCQKTSPNLIL